MPDTRRKPRIVSEHAENRSGLYMVCPLPSRIRSPPLVSFHARFSHLPQRHASRRLGPGRTLAESGRAFIGKTNVPEFAMGSHTYNNVYGATLNPYDLTKSAGGSSGGAAAALAAGFIPIANGSDLGGSLRNPGNFNNIVGFRPSVGLIPTAPAPMPFGNLSVKGPLARSVGDVAFLLSIMAGQDDRDPACYPSDPALFTKPLERDFKNMRIAWCPISADCP